MVTDSWICWACAVPFTYSCYTTEDWMSELITMIITWFAFILIDQWHYHTINCEHHWWTHFKHYCTCEWFSLCWSLGWRWLDQVLCQLVTSSHPGFVCHVSAVRSGIIVTTLCHVSYQSLSWHLVWKSSPSVMALNSCQDSVHTSPPESCNLSAACSPTHSCASYALGHVTS